MFVPKSLDEQTIASNAEWVREKYGVAEAARYVALEYAERKKEGRVDDPQYTKELEAEKAKMSLNCVQDYSLGDCITLTPCVPKGYQPYDAPVKKEKKERGYYVLRSSSEFDPDGNPHGSEAAQVFAQPCTRRAV